MPSITHFVYLFVLLQGLTIIYLLFRIPSPEVGYCSRKREISQENLRSNNAEARERKLLCMVILSTPTEQGEARREAIRNTWLQLKYKGRPIASEFVTYKFFIGGHSLPSGVKSGLLKEKQKFGDLVLLPGLIDSYANLTLKVLTSFLWTDTNEYFTFLLKCDDDTFVQLNIIIKELLQRVHEEKHKMLYWGFFRGDSHVKRSGKWKETKWFLCDRYLPYAHGGGYILSHDLVGLIANNSKFLAMYNSEDVSVGVWLAAFDVNRVHDVRFDTEFVSRGCQNQYVISHKQSIQNMRERYSNILNNGVLCKKEYQTYPSFDYLWHELPSKCCKRSFDFI